MELSSQLLPKNAPSDVLALAAALPRDLQREILSYLHCSTDGCSLHLAHNYLVQAYPYKCAECSHGLLPDGIDVEDPPSSGCPVAYSRCGLVRRCCNQKLVMTLFTPMQIHARESDKDVVIHFCNAMCLLRYLKMLSSPALELRELRFCSVSDGLRQNVIFMSGDAVERVQTLRDFIGRNMRKVRVDLNALFYTTDPCAYYKVVMLDVHWSIYRYYRSFLRSLESKFEDAMEVVNQGISHLSILYSLVPVGIKNAKSFSDLLVHLTNLKYLTRTTRLWRVMI